MYRHVASDLFMHAILSHLLPPRVEETQYLNTHLHPEVAYDRNWRPWLPLSVYIHLREGVWIYWYCRDRDYAFYCTYDTYHLEEITWEG